ncbi:hypothetical protein L596_012038 [Steinernema carpocapsae]|uniref:Uncharacterized protein n=1 Tax=Steinernema carpocapsae TaxID=34508 RepID=A0A4V6A4Q3_STECR|nr:hypothetical protein L596_012038 [Steinernema carpocapsae]
MISFQRTGLGTTSRPPLHRPDVLRRPQPAEHLRRRTLSTRVRILLDVTRVHHHNRLRNATRTSENR